MKKFGVDSVNNFSNFYEIERKTLEGEDSNPVTNEVAECVLRPINETFTIALNQLKPSDKQMT